VENAGNSPSGICGVDVGTMMLQFANFKEKKQRIKEFCSEFWCSRKGKVNLDDFSTRGKDSTRFH
jgi:hypothetical protein